VGSGVVGRGLREGFSTGPVEGSSLGSTEGSAEGSAEGSSDGSGLGVSEGSWVGSGSPRGPSVTAGSVGMTLSWAARSLHAARRESARAAHRVMARIRFFICHRTPLIA